MNKTLVICVLYNPSQEILNRWFSLSSLKNENIVFCFIDNSTKNHKNDIPDCSVYICNGKNLGIAEAQNKGIEYAIDNNFGYTVFFDQDSTITYEYIDQIVNEYNRIKNFVPNIGILGPTVINISTNEPYKSQNVKSIHNFKIVGCLISSGTIIETNTLKKVGFMDKEMFIDYVDFEWCWRAKSKGYVSVMTELVTIEHKVGEIDKNFLSFPIIISKPIRYYYQYRNWIWLCRRLYVPLDFKIKNGLRKIFELIYVPFISNNDISILKKMLRGIKDGIKIKSNISQ